MIQFVCTNCAHRFTLSDDKKGVYAVCPLCDELLVEPVAQGSEEFENQSAPDSSQQILRYVRGALALALLLCLPVWVWQRASPHFSNRPTSISSDAKMSRTDVEVREQLEAKERAEKLVEQHKAEAERLRNEVGRYQAESARQRVEKARTEATDISNRSIGELRRQLKRFEAHDRLNRDVVRDGDRIAMSELVELEINPAIILVPASTFSMARMKFIAEQNTELLGMWFELRKRAVDASWTLADPKYPADAKIDFESTVARELARAETLLKQPYGDPMVAYKDAVTAAKAGHEALRKQKVEKSKRASEALNEYQRQGSEDSSAVLLMHQLMAKLQALDAAKKLTVQSAEEVFRQSGIRKGDETYAVTFNTLGRIAGDLRIDHNPDNPSLAETRHRLLFFFSPEPKK